MPLTSTHLLCGAGGDAQVTRQAGNAVPVNMARWIGERLAEVLV